MKLRRLVFMIGAALALVAGTTPALAGGWAVTSVDSVPNEFVAGETYDVEYSVLQHGQHPVTMNDTSLTFTSDSGEMLVFQGKVLEGTERHVAQVTLPSSGNWTWTANQGIFGDQELGSLTVMEAGASTSLWTSTPARLALIAALAVVLGLLVLQFALMRRSDTGRGRLQPAPGIAGAD